MFQRNSKIYRTTEELLALLEEQNCPSAVIKALKDINCDEWTLCNNDEETLLEELKLSKLQLRALFKIINGSSCSSSFNSAPANRPQIVSDVIDSKYINNGFLGMGACGKVYKVSLKDKPHIKRAIKVMKDTLEFTVNEALKEVVQTMKVAHKHVVQIYDVNISTDRSLLIIEMECYISPANILIRSIDLDNDEIVVCLADFGFAKSFEHSSQFSYVRGKPGYLAPEISLFGENEVGSVQPYSIASDIYALGATLFCLLTFNLFNGNNSKLLSTLDGYPPNLSTAILKMLGNNPIDRDLGIILKLLDSLDKGNGVDMYNLGMKYKNGNGCEKSYEKAFEWFQKSAEQGDAYGQNELGNCYYNGRGTTQDFKKAFEWYQKSAEQGNAYGQTCLGACYYNGEGTTQDYKKAFEWFQKSAEQYDQNELGNCYYNGKGDGDDAQSMLVHTQNMLGNCYCNGKGTTQDFKKAFEWYQKSAEQGDAHGQTCLGACYYTGKGTTQDFKKAFEWFQKSAEQGDADAQNALGDCYYNGEGTTQDFKKAFEWFQKSAEQGNSNSKKRAEILRKHHPELF